MGNLSVEDKAPGDYSRKIVEYRFCQSIWMVISINGIFPFLKKDVVETKDQGMKASPSKGFSGVHKNLV